MLNSKRWFKLANMSEILHSGGQKKWEMQDFARVGGHSGDYY